MKHILPPANASFNASAKTITFSPIVPQTISHILQVANITRGVLYFQPQAGPNYSGSYASPVLTLNASTTGHTNSDALLIFYDDGLIAETVSPKPAQNSWGQALAVTTGATGTLTHIPSAAPGFEIKGFVGHGTGDGYFFVQINSSTVLSGRTRSTLPCLSVVLPNGIAVPSGAVIDIKVTNESGSTADYESTLLGA